jgi:hypothetical protein
MGRFTDVAESFVLPRSLQVAKNDVRMGDYLFH